MEKKDYIASWVLFFNKIIPIIFTKDFKISKKDRKAILFYCASKCFHAYFGLKYAAKYHPRARVISNYEIESNEYAAISEFKNLFYSNFESATMTHKLKKGVFENFLDGKGYEYYFDAMMISIYNYFCKNNTMHTAAKKMQHELCMTFETRKKITDKIKQHIGDL